MAGKKKAPAKKRTPRKVPTKALGTGLLGNAAKAAMDRKRRLRDI